MLLTLVGGLVLLIVGAEALVRGSAALARRLGVGPLVVGLTVVAFGTSAPELVVSARAALAGAGDIALGNVLGSNIANILLILGLAAMIRPLRIQTQLVRIDIPIMIVVSLLFFLVLADRRVSQLEGLLLLCGIAVYTASSIVLARREQDPALRRSIEGGLPVWPRALAGQLAAIAGGLALLVLGANVFVKGAVRMAGALGVSEALIGLTVVAVGTSLPELATSVVAAAKGEGDIAVGNVVGSNVFNLLGILGASAALRPIVAVEIGAADLLAMVAAALLLLPLARSGLRLRRWEAALLLSVYVGYVLFRSASSGP